MSENPGTQDPHGAPAAGSRGEPAPGPRDAPASGAHRAGRARLALATLAAVVALIPVAIAVALLSQGTPAPPPGSSTAPIHLTVASPAAGAPSAPASAPARPSASLRLPRGPGALVATLVRRTALRAAPGGRRLATLQLRTQWGSAQVLWVRRVVGRWLGVVSTEAGNNRLGWIPASAATLGRVDWELRVSLEARRLEVIHAGRVLARYTIAIGAPASPTPTGNFDVTDRLLTGDPGGPYGCCILALSAVAPHAIPDWTGGNRIAIHSTPETWSIGRPVSHGCMRLTLPEGRWLVDHIPLGTPTVISSA
ncbi:MAG TPA: L,D-transpeptidase [Solirubrobacteraceae bacterium]|nr:L,D-transpeptidase [Solirubrobacteraceae bacterium]